MGTSEGAKKCWISRRRNGNLGGHTSETAKKVWQIRKQNNTDRVFTFTNKQGPLIEANSIQATIWPDISNTRCWIVSSKKNNQSINKSSSLIERYSRRFWEEINGKKPKGMFLCHKCDRINGACVNPNHLFLGTNKDNMKDCSLKGRAGTTSEEAKKRWESRRKNGNDKLKPQTIEKIWNTRKINMKLQSELALLR